MDKLTHFAALKAASRVAFGIVVLGGCSAAATEEDTVASESEINAKAPCPSKQDAGTDAAPSKPSCENVLASAFPDGGNDFSSMQNPPKVSDEVKTCCAEHLASEDENTWQLQYRWSCCGVLDNWNNPDPKISMACTPWGPPVPPAMKRMKAVA
jgi:hypothetical protein